MRFQKLPILLLCLCVAAASAAPCLASGGHKARCHAEPCGSDSAGAGALMPCCCAGTAHPGTLDASAAAVPANPASTASHATPAADGGWEHLPSATPAPEPADPVPLYLLHASLLR